MARVRGLPSAVIAAVRELLAAVMERGYSSQTLPVALPGGELAAEIDCYPGRTQKLRYTNASLAQVAVRPP